MRQDHRPAPVGPSGTRCGSVHTAFIGAEAGHPGDEDRTRSRPASGLPLARRRPNRSNRPGAAAGYAVPIIVVAFLALAVAARRRLVQNAARVARRQQARTDCGPGGGKEGTETPGGLPAGRRRAASRRVTAAVASSRTTGRCPCRPSRAPTGPRSSAWLRPAQRRRRRTSPCCDRQAASERRGSRPAGRTPHIKKARDLEMRSNKAEWDELRRSCPAMCSAPPTSGSRMSGRRRLRRRRRTLPGSGVRGDAGRQSPQGRRPRQGRHAADGGAEYRLAADAFAEAKMLVPDDDIELLFREACRMEARGRRTTPPARSRQKLVKGAKVGAAAYDEERDRSRAADTFLSGVQEQDGQLGRARAGCQLGPARTGRKGRRRRPERGHAGAGRTGCRGRTGQMGAMPPRGCALPERGAALARPSGPRDAAAGPTRRRWSAFANRAAACRRPDGRRAAMAAQDQPRQLRPAAEQAMRTGQQLVGAPSAERQPPRAG
jgi:hypothetical protein